MTKIKIDCFATNDLCQINSSEKSIKINNPLENEFALEIFNHGDNACEVKLKTNNVAINNDLEIVNLMINNEKQIFFKGDFLNSVENEIALGLITPQSSGNYIFSLDLLDLVLGEKRLTLGFDLVFDFNCEAYVDKRNQVEKTVDLRAKTMGPAVLSSHNVASESVKPSDSLFKSPIYFLLLLILFVAILFVIMKFTNDQKKKKQAKTVD